MTHRSWFLSQPHSDARLVTAVHVGIFRPPNTVPRGAYKKLSRKGELFASTSDSSVVVAPGTKAGSPRWDKGLSSSVIVPTGSAGIRGVVNEGNPRWVRVLIN